MAQNWRSEEIKKILFVKGLGYSKWKTFFQDKVEFYLKRIYGGKYPPKNTILVPRNDDKGRTPGVYIDFKRSRINFANTNDKVATFVANVLDLSRDKSDDEIRAELEEKLEANNWEMVRAFFRVGGKHFQAIIDMLEAMGKAGDRKEVLGVEVLQHDVYHKGEVSINKVGESGGLRDMIEGVDVEDSLGRTYQVKTFRKATISPDGKKLFIWGTKGFNKPYPKIDYLFFIQGTKSNYTYLLLKNDGIDRSSIRTTKGGHPFIVTEVFGSDGKHKVVKHRGDIVKAQFNKQTRQKEDVNALPRHLHSTAPSVEEFTDKGLAIMKGFIDKIENPEDRPTITKGAKGIISVKKDKKIKFTQIKSFSSINILGGTFTLKGVRNPKEYNKLAKTILFVNHSGDYIFAKNENIEVVDSMVKIPKSSINATSIGEIQETYWYQKKLLTENIFISLF